MIKLEQFTSVEELYRNRKTPTGELIMDALVFALNNTRTIQTSDIALFLGVNERSFREAVTLLTGMQLKDILQHWRLLQAKELWDAHQAGFKDVDDFVKTKTKEAPEGFQLSKRVKDSYRKEVSLKSFEEVAKRCGWRSYKSLLRVANRFGVSFEIAKRVRKQ
ncbi:MAG: hypothetical protein IKX59_03950 [Bacteroidales bacterium]|nr:hypothetical protein [Bacteroidales bacterium]